MKTLPIIVAGLILLMLSGCIFEVRGHHHDHDGGYGQNSSPGGEYGQHPQG